MIERWTFAFKRLSTSAKLIVILSLALMPLGVIALLASLSTTRNADAERRSDLRVAVAEASRKLSAELATDIAVMRASARMASSAYVIVDPDATTTAITGVCARLTEVFGARPTGPISFALFGAGPVPVCANSDAKFTRPPELATGDEPRLRLVDNGVDLMLRAADGRASVVAHYSRTALAEFARPAGYGSPYALSLDVDGANYQLTPDDALVSWQRTETMSMPVGIDMLTLTMTVPSVPFGAAEALLAFLPLLMWASAAAVGFYVVDRLLIRPLKALRLSVAHYEPGSTQRLLAETPSIEISELEESFAAFADRLADRERDVEAALVAQVKLTREVHHRVKNNLQVIASLISLHARGTRAPEALSAYASIQRRVDALSIVHRNHFAELEASRGIEVKTLLGELVANFRANAESLPISPRMTVTSVRLCVDQDVAMPLAFLLTEIAEMALFADPAAPIVIDAVAAGEGRARLTIQSVALMGAVRDDAGPGARIIEGLARQLRSQLVFDAATGRYQIEFSADH